MLLYITAEDVMGSEGPERRGPRPLHTIPPTVARLYDLGMRHHIREAAMVWWTQDAPETVPDWRLDRLVIRVALYCRERLSLEPGDRVAVFGRLGWLWPAVDFAAMGFGAVAVGIEHDVKDEDVAGLLTQAGPRVAFASDDESARRLRGLKDAGRLPPLTAVAGTNAAEGPGLLPLARLLELAGTLDTAERAQAFRAVAREIAPDVEALWHASASGLVRLTHKQAMERIARDLGERPAE
jgi:acyl-CoA synthetase (AMP-forming)/AMP-acid ligase II